MMLVHKLQVITSVHAAACDRHRPHLHLPADLLDDRQLIQVERGSTASVIRQLHDVLGIFLNVLAHVWHTQQLLN